MIYESSTSDANIGGVFCGMCGRKMCHDADHDMWRCPSCHGGAGWRWSPWGGWYLETCLSDWGTTIGEEAEHGRE